MALKFSVYDPILFILFRLIKINKMLQLYILSIYVHAWFMQPSEKVIKCGVTQKSTPVTCFIKPELGIPSVFPSKIPETLDIRMFILLLGANNKISQIFSNMQAPINCLISSFTQASTHYSLILNKLRLKQS